MFCPAHAYFERGSTTILQDGLKWLPVAAQTVVSGKPLEVIGVTPRGAVGDARARALAQRRAELVRDLLIERGASVDRLRVMVKEAPPGIEAAEGTELGAVVTRPGADAPPP